MLGMKILSMKNSEIDSLGNSLNNTHLIDKYLPEYQFSEHHQIEVNAKPDVVFNVAKELDISGCFVSKILFGIRSVPYLFTKTDQKKPLLNLSAFLDGGFTLLEEDPPQEYVLGIVGQFWKPLPTIKKLTPGDFTAFTEPNFAKAAWNFRISGNPTLPRSHLSTTTRIFCPPRYRGVMKIYWAAIQVFSGLVRKDILKQLKRISERS